MALSSRLTWLMVLPLLGSANLAQAQYYYPYGTGYVGNGFGGWGGTAGGDIARGMGAFAAGKGVYNYDTSVATSIDANTLMRYNEYLYQSQQLANQREAQRIARRSQTREEAYEARLKRLRDTPTEREIFNGDALNFIHDQMLDPKLMSGSSLRQADVKVPGRVIRDIPFRFSTEAITISLDQLTDEKAWPIELRAKEFDAERSAYAKAVDDALEENSEGDLKPETVARVRQAVSQLYQKVELTIPKTRQPDHLNAINYLKGLAGFSRMLQKPDFEKVLAELENTKETTLGHLIGFMGTYNLRFAPATTPAQREAYTSLYPIMASQKNRLIAQEPEPQQPKAATKKDQNAPLRRAPAPTDLFRGIDPRYLNPSDPKAQPQPEATPAPPERATPAPVPPEAQAAPPAPANPPQS